MDWQARYYPLDVFQSLEQKIEAMIQSRTCEAAQIVREEIDAVALAKVKEGIVVSQETSAQEKRNPKRSHFIPDVCRDLGIACINLLGLMRREKWTI